MVAGATHCLESASVHYWDLILVLFIVSLNEDDFILPGHNVMGFEFVEKINQWAMKCMWRES